MGLSGSQLVGEPVQFGSCKGLGVGEAALSLWVQTHRDCPWLSLVPASLPKWPKAEGMGEPGLSRYLSRQRSESFGNSPCGNGGRA